ncbi:hypothetical protein GCM10025867_51390 (plasmid) [Frondihabitans sucicola]|uniref:Conjugal transfer protein n=1 Tax=Frondihabitans sucicola TaxID=1268041 RepID=A0ABM8GV31_9MICO|nr:hypothetical protein [Frondihabitans sucicola]BDZ52331.1 hypothetical protein GCM10025867_45720 [Frondihabitans sucicola]BDZ52898.1 hypothetical protein GCM10025867_51390 [Frondihabitans sucicola]
MTIQTNANASIPRATLGTPDAVTWSRQRFGLLPFIFWGAWVGPVLTVSAAGSMAAGNDVSPWVIVVGLAMTAFALKMILPAARKTKFARAAFREWVARHTPTLTETERHYFIRHCEAEVQNLWGKNPSWFIQGPTSPDGKYDLRLVVE